MTRLAIITLALIVPIQAAELCAPVEQVYSTAKQNTEISDVLPIAQKKIPAIEKILPVAIDPTMPPSSGLLVIWHDRKAILFVVINELICGRGTDVLYDEIPKLQAALSRREFKLYPKQYRKPRRRLHTIRYAARPVVQIERPVAGKAME